MSTQEITRYITEIDKIYKTGKATEHSYRPALKTLIENLTTGLTITNEPKQIDCGAPDYIITKNDIPLGYIEAKDILVGLNNKSNKAQFDRYKQSLGNIIFTDYLTFQLFVDGNHLTTVSIAELTGKVITPIKKEFETFITFINHFTGYKGKTIYKSLDLAKMMALKAKLLSEIINKTLADNDSKESTLFGQLEGFRKILIRNLDVSSFADIYAQTLAYGLFAARLNQKDSQVFKREIAAKLIPLSNPFLRKFFNYIAGIDLDERICWIVDALAELFNAVSIEDIYKEFSKENQDPFIHFYETFLAEYDPALRESRGVYYTPLPVVQFIVQAVDDILKKEFGLSKGLADNSKIKLPTKNEKSENNKREYHKVQILDPATGTGTFLAEVIHKIAANFTKQKGMWSGYCDEHLIPRINGFEVLMASYAMAHFKLDMTLKETGYSGEGNSRLRVYLTNSLDEPENISIKLPMVEWLTDEAKEANSVKKDTPVMVILGNPPYSGESSNFTPEEFLAPYKKEPGGIEKLNERNPKWLNDDYVKFIRYGQIFIEKYGDGILAFINNHSFLDNPTFRGMRWHLLQTFDKIYILDLHGNALKKETSPDGSKDENVFDIKQGVSINIFIKTGKKKQGEQAEVLHTDLYGLRKIKNIWFSKNTIKSIEWKNINPVEPFYFFAQKDFTNIDGYNEGFGIQELFAVNGVGITTAHDEFVISDNRNKLIDLFTNFKNTQGNVDLLHNTFNVRKKQGWDILKGWLNLQSENNIENFVKEIMYRPFDNKYIFYEDKLVWRTVKNIMRHFFADNNLGLIVGRQGQVVGSMAWNLIFITKNIADFNSYYRGGGTVFPLYLYPDKDVLDQTETRQPNLNADIIKTLAIKLKLQFTPEKTDDKKTFAPIDILDYIYAVLHSPTYRIKYKEFLKIDFPKVPYPSDVKQFRSFVAFGSKLRELHLLENVAPAENLAVYPMEGNNEIEKVFFEDKKVWINSKQYFAKVPQEVWDYFIGGYQPAQKWLKDRKGRTLTFDEIEHYQKIINVLKMTIELQKRIDAVLL